MGSSDQGVTTAAEKKKVERSRIVHGARCGIGLDFLMDTVYMAGLVFIIHWRASDFSADDHHNKNGILPFDPSSDSFSTCLRESL